MTISSYLKSKYTQASEFFAFNHSYLRLVEPPPVENRSEDPRIECHDYLVLEQLRLDERSFTDFSSLAIAKDLTVTLLFQGTGRVYDATRSMSLVAKQAAEQGHWVFMINGIGTVTETSLIESFREDVGWRGDLIPSYASYDKPRTNMQRLKQAMSANTMLENAFLALKAIRSLGCIPGQINISGYSRGGVSATILAALLDYLIRPLDHRSVIKLALFDPVASFHSLDSRLVDRGLIAHNSMIPEKGMLVFTSLDPQRRFRPQEGNGASKETQLTLPTNHQGLEGGDPEQDHHQMASVITRLLTMKHFDLVLTEQQDLGLLEASVALSEIQEDLALRMRWCAEEKEQRKNVRYHISRLLQQDAEFRIHGKLLIDDITLNRHSFKALFLDDMIINTFQHRFSEYFDIIDAYFAGDSLSDKQKNLYFFECRMLLLCPTTYGYQLLSKIADALREHLECYRMEILREARLKKMLKQVSTMVQMPLEADQLDGRLSGHQDTLGGKNAIDYPFKFDHQHWMFD